MRSVLVICLSLATRLHAVSSAPPISTSTTAASSTTSPPFDMDFELKEISLICLTDREHELLAGDIFKIGIARGVNANLVREAQEVIGVEELRDVLGFAPLGPWTNYSEPSKEEIEAASTIEEYYTLSEPRSKTRSLDSLFFNEKNFPPAIAFLDKRIPTVRIMYRNKFAEIRRRPDAKVEIDRKEVDLMIHEYLNIVRRLYRAFDAWIVSDCRLRELEKLEKLEKNGSETGSNE